MTRFAGIVFVLLMLAWGTEARAQLSFQLGFSDGRILGIMAQNGYHDVEITKKKLTKAQAQGCRDGKRYKVEMNLEGKIKKAIQIGDCRRPINPQIARNILRNSGFSNVLVRPEGNRFTAVGCRQGRRVRVVMNVFGEIKGEKLLGRCGRAMSEHDVAAFLRAQGYSRLNVKRGGRGRFAVEACRGDDRLGLVVDRNGVIERQRRIGRCDPPIHPAAIPSLLAGYGFSRIEVVDRRLPRYVAHACRGNDKLEITMNRFGEISDERRIGRCDPPLTSAMLEQRLSEAGYTGVRIIEQRANGFVAEVCEDATMLRLDLTIFGETVRQQATGRCPTRPIGDVVGDYERQGVSDPTVFIEGCRRGRRVRIELDAVGDEVHRRNIGRC